MKKVIVFDMDGVLIDSIEIAYQLSRDTFPMMTKEQFLELSAGNYHDEMAKFRLVNQPVIRTEEEKQARKIYYAEKKAESPVFPGALELLQHLHSKGFVLVLNTSAFERNCLPILEKAGMKDFFDLIATVEMGKSKAEKFEMIKTKYNVSTEEMLFITDTVGDIREAKQVGVETIAVSWGAHDDTYFTREPHTNLIKTVHSMQELEDAISG